MIAGRVTGLLEATIPVLVLGTDGLNVEVEAVIDTGFNGYLTLSPELVQNLDLHAAGTRRATLADGSVVALSVYLARVRWLGSDREILVIEAKGGALAGMSLLHGSRVSMNIVEDGSVLVEPLS